LRVYQAPAVEDLQLHTLTSNGDRLELLALAVLPANHLDKVGDKAWDVTLDYHVVALNDMSLVHVGVVPLDRNYNSQEQQLRIGP